MPSMLSSTSVVRIGVEQLNSHPVYLVEFHIQMLPLNHNVYEQQEVQRGEGGTKDDKPPL